MNPVILEKRGIVVPTPEVPLTYNHLRPGDMLYVEYSPEYLIFVDRTLDFLIFISVHQTGYFSKRRIPRETLEEGDSILADAGWEVYRP